MAESNVLYNDARLGPFQNFKLGQFKQQSNFVCHNFFLLLSYIPAETNNFIHSMHRALGESKRVCRVYRNSAA